MNLIVVQDLPRLHVTPLASIRVEDSHVIVEVDDERERRIELVFQPYQAVRVITADCFVLPAGVSIVPQTVVEVVGSEWIAALKTNLKQVDETAKFMNKARHFIVPLQDDFLEVVAWNVVSPKATTAPTAG